MASKRKGLSKQAVVMVLAFTFKRWTEHPGHVMGIAAAMLLATLADVTIPMLAGRMVGAISAGNPDTARDWYHVVMIFAWLLGLGISALILRSISIKLIITMTLGIMQNLFSGSFARIQRFSSDWHANTFAGSTVRKITRGGWAIDALNDILLIELLPCVVMLVGTSVLLAVHWPLMGLFIGVLSILYIITIASLSLFYMSPAATLANAQDTRLSGTLADALTCNQVVKAFGAETREDQRLQRVITKWMSRARRLWVRGLIYACTQQGMMWGIQLVILGAGIWLWRHHRANVGDIAYVMTAYLVVQGYLRDIGVQLRGMQRAVNDMEELVELMDQPFGVKDMLNASPIAIRHGEIQFKHVDFCYSNRTEKLYDDFSLTIASGERVGLVGHSGSGKSSFIKLIQRLHDIDAGHITIDDQDIAKVQQSSLRSQIAIVQQEPILFHRSLAENIAYARPNATEAEIVEAARLASAHDFIMEQPRGYRTLVGERGVKLSGGERQRIAIARAFLADASILILDEATSSLDSESERLIQNAIERLMVGRTTIVVAHRLSTVRSLDRLLVMDHGRVAEEGTHDALILRQNGIYRHLFERQALDLLSPQEAIK